MKPTLLLRIFLSTAVAMTVLFAVAGWFLLREASEALSDGVTEEVRGSLTSVEALWRAHGDTMRSSSALLSTMSDVRAAFGTRDPRTIQDTAAEIWTRTASPDTLLLVAGADDGAVLATVGGRNLQVASLPSGWLEAATMSFPQQASGFAIWNSSLWQVVVTPVYVDSSGDRRLLLNVLAAAEPVSSATLERLRQDTGGTGFILSADGSVLARTSGTGSGVSRQLELKGMDGKQIGTLVARRPLLTVESRIASLRTAMALAWVGAMLAGLVLSYWLTRRITKPVGELEKAALEVSRENYSVRVDESSRDELGLLAKTFNRMCESIDSARSELIRREQINAAGRLAASIAHDLRNPLSAVTAGAEMISEMDLPADQTKRAAKNVHSAAMRMQQMLEELSQSVRKKSAVQTEANLLEVVESALQSQEAKLAARELAVSVDVPAGITVQVERGRFERVIINLLSNSLEALPKGGAIRLTAMSENGNVVLDVRDNGPGIPAEIRRALFQPFVTQGKKSGLGLGLALSRQTMLDHGGELEAVYADEPGAWFRLRLPLKKVTSLE